MYGNFFPNLSSVISENARLPPILFLPSGSPCYDLIFLRSHKPRKNTFVLVGKFLKKLEYLGPTRNAQNVCAVTKGGTFLKPCLCAAPEKTAIQV